MNITESKKTYIHYGHIKFDPEKFVEIRNRQSFTKPFGGLWASAVDAKYGWKQWAEEEDFRVCEEKNSFKFRLKPGNKILTLRETSDIHGCPELEEALCMYKDWDYHPDYERLKKMGIDAVEIENIDAFQDILWGWDCDSILVLNPDVIEEVMK